MPGGGWNNVFGKSLAQVIKEGRWGLMQLWSDNTSYYRLGNELALLFRSTDGLGEWEAEDPFTGQVMQWQDWKPIAGENAWVVKALLRTHYYEYGKVRKKSLELEQAERIAGNAIKMQAENGGVRFAPPGTYHDATGDTEFMWNEISTENNISWYGAFRGLYEITGNIKYKKAMDKIGEEYFPSVAEFDPATGDCYFQQGMHYYPGRGWVANTGDFATDCQTWAISCLGPQKINEIFNKKYGRVREYRDKVGEKGAAFQVWKTTVKKAGQTRNGTLIGLAYTENQDVVSVEWTAGGIQAALTLSDYYKKTMWEKQLFGDAVSMRIHLETMKKVLFNGSIAYPYASERVEIPFGWNAPPKEVSSTTSTAWIGFLNNGIDPWRLDKKIPRADELLLKLVEAIKQGRTKAVPEAQGRPAEKQQTDVADSGGITVLSAKPIVGRAPYHWPDNRQGPSYSSYAVGDYIISDKTTHIRATFPKTDVGIYARLRLLPKGEDPNSSIGACPKFLIPKSGVKIIPIGNFGLSRSQRSKLGQISVHSGGRDWTSNLNDSDDDRADYLSVEELVAKQSSAGVASDEVLGRRSFVKRAAVLTGEVALLGAAAGCASDIPDSDDTLNIESSEAIITAPTSFWPENGQGPAFSCYALGKFDLSDATHIRFVFPKSQAGTNFKARLLPKGGNPNIGTGAAERIITIPENGEAIIALSEFPLSESQLKDIEQISVHSGSIAWFVSLDQPDNKHATYQRVDKLVAKQSSAGSASDVVLDRRNFTKKTVVVAGAGVLGKLLLALSCAPTAQRERPAVVAGQQQAAVAAGQPPVQAMPALDDVSASTSALEAAFNAINAKNYKEAIRIAEEAIAAHPEWLIASRKQAEYVDERLKKDPDWLGTITSATTAREISKGKKPNTYTAECGALHDLGGLYYNIVKASHRLLKKAKSEEEQAQHTRRAVDAVKVLLKEFQHSWVWDSHGPWFWAVVKNGILGDAYYDEFYKQAIEELKQGNYKSPIDAAAEALKSSSSGQLSFAEQIKKVKAGQSVSLDLSNTDITDLTLLKDLVDLEELDLSGTNITDITPLKDLAKLKILLLYGTNIADITPLKDLVKLERLNLSATKITDLTPLKDLANLERLYLDNNTGITNLRWRDGRMAKSSSAGVQDILEAAAYDIKAAIGSSMITDNRYSRLKELLDQLGAKVGISDLSNDVLRYIQPKPTFVKGVEHLKGLMDPASPNVPMKASVDHYDHHDPYVTLCDVIIPGRVGRPKETIERIWQQVRAHVLEKSAKGSSAGRAAAKITEFASQINSLEVLIRNIVQRPVTTAAAAAQEWRSIEKEAATLQDALMAFKMFTSTTGAFTAEPEAAAVSAMAAAKEEALKAGAKKTEALADNIIDGVMAAGLVRRISEAAVKLTDVKAAESATSVKRLLSNAYIESTDEIESQLDAAATKQQVMKADPVPMSYLDTLKEKFNVNMQVTQLGTIPSLVPGNAVAIASTSEGRAAFKKQGFKQVIMLQEIDTGIHTKLEHLAVIVRGWDLLTQIEDLEQREEIWRTMGLAYTQLTGRQIPKELLANPAEFILEIILKPGPYYEEGQLENYFMQRILILRAA